MSRVGEGDFFQDLIFVDSNSTARQSSFKLATVSVNCDVEEGAVFLNDLEAKSFKCRGRRLDSSSAMRFGQDPRSPLMILAALAWILSILDRLVLLALIQAGVAYSKIGLTSARTMGHNCEVVVINEGAEDRALSVVEGTAPRLMLAVEVSKDEYIGDKGQDKEKKLQSPTQKDLKILQLNVEGFTRAKGEIIEKMMREHKADVIALQETHTPENSKSAIRIPGYVIICSKPHPKFGLAIYITYKLREETKVLPETSHSIGIQINDLSIYNVYKPPSQLWIPTSLPSPQHPAIVLGDFNSHHTLWGYSSTDNEGESLNDWMEINDMQLIFDAKKQGTFQSARWGKTYSPDLCFVTKDQCDNPIQIAHKILTKFPKSQHCPSIYEMGIQIPQIDSAPIPRWNLGKANWEAFTKYIEDNINLIPPTPKNYSRASNLIISCAKKFIPRGHRKIYIPCWSPESERLYQEYNLSGNTETAENLIRSLDDSRKHRWHTMLEQMDFSKSSRKSWSLLRKLGGADPPHKHNQLTNPNKIATCISSKSRIHPNPSEKSRLKKHNTTMLASIDLNEVEDAIKVTHNNRAPGPDGIMPEFMKHLGQKAIKWMAKLFTNILSTGSIPSVWKQAKVLAILKPGKTSDDPNNYRPISLLCIPYKILERIILNRISPIIEEYLPIEQAGFRPGRNCAEQTLALTTTIEDGFQKKLKTGAVFVDLTAAYNTVWREGLLYKLSKIINCKNIIKLINNFLTNRKITVHLNNKKSRPRTLNNGLPQGSVLAPLLFNVYTADIPATNSQKFLYADDIALLHQEQSFSTLEQILNEDLKKLENFFSKWHLIPNPSKTVSSVFHLNNHKANRPLKLTFCNKPLSHDPCPKYLGVTLDRSLTFRQHLEKTRDKLKTRNNIMTRLAGTTWGCGADTLRTTALALVYSVAEYCAPVWERSSHTDSIDAQLNQTMRLITGNMRPTPIDWLPYLSNIAPPDLRRKKSTSNLLSKIKANTKLPINTVLEIPPPTRLISRNPAWVADENVDLKEEWRNRWSNLAIANKDLVEDPNTKPPGYNLPRRTWSTLNRIRTSTGRCNYLLNKWNMSPDQNCDCGQIQTMHHILRDCPRRFFQGTLGDIHRCTEEALENLPTLLYCAVKNNIIRNNNNNPVNNGIVLDITHNFPPVNNGVVLDITHIFPPVNNGDVLDITHIFHPVNNGVVFDITHFFPPVNNGDVLDITHIFHPFNNGVVLDITHIFHPVNNGVVLDITHIFHPVNNGVVLDITHIFHPFNNGVVLDITHISYPDNNGVVLDITHISYPDNNGVVLDITHISYPDNNGVVLDINHFFQPVNNGVVLDITHIFHTVNNGVGFDITHFFHPDNNGPPPIIDSCIMPLFLMKNYLNGPQFRYAYTSLEHNLLRQLLDSEGLSTTWEDIILTLVHDATSLVHPEIHSENDDLDIRQYIKVKKIDKKGKKEMSPFIVDLGRALTDEHLATRNLNSLPLQLQATIQEEYGSSKPSESTMPQQSDTPKRCYKCPSKSASSRVDRGKQSKQILKRRTKKWGMFFHISTQSYKGVCGNDNHQV
ncbi:hypothetical protein LAZ67_10002087 [Cordylochernes scorpioides]|uniref:Reverse transcriptase domain-containing protein n=1 Tax=Cordylochernes scorpioides TaxID=51811 RepID=A0ABY6L061_9ARAC|nr:hypothetical protein LAZ67_10002087 [Cordylochernes scorpioides]